MDIKEALTQTSEAFSTITNIKAWVTWQSFTILTNIILYQGVYTLNPQFKYSPSDLSQCRLSPTLVTAHYSRHGNVLGIVHTHSRLTALCPGLLGWAGNRKVKPIWILLKTETVSGSGISWAICKSSPRSRQITTPAPHHSVFHRPDTLPAAQPTASKHWRSSSSPVLNPVGMVNWASWLEFQHQNGNPTNARYVSMQTCGRGKTFCV